MATTLVQLSFKILLSSSCYIMILKCLLLHRHNLVLPTYTTIDIAMTYQIQITRLC